MKDGKHSMAEEQRPSTSPPRSESPTSSFEIDDDKLDGLPNNAALWRLFAKQTYVNYEVTFLLSKVVNGEKVESGELRSLLDKVKAVDELADGLIGHYVDAPDAP
jgi:hypothetical protein